MDTLGRYLEGKEGSRRLAAIVLRKAASGEADLVVTFLTREVGLVPALAKNGRKSVRRFGGGLLEPGRAARYFFRFKPGRDLALVERGEEEEGLSPPHLPQVYALASFALELVLAFEAVGNPAPTAFDLLLRHLKNLKAVEQNLYEARCLSLSFCLKYLESAGFGPHFDACLICGKKPSLTETWLWEPKGGGLYCQGCLNAAGTAFGATRVPANLLSRFCGVHPGRPFSEEDLRAAETFFEKMAAHAAGRSFRALAVFRGILEE